jgi:hypothetical protein
METVLSFKLGNESVLQDRYKNEMFVFRMIW